MRTPNVGKLPHETGAKLHQQCAVREPREERQLLLEYDAGSGPSYPPRES